MRKTILPAKYEIEGARLLFPKDEEAGGTWIGVSDRKRLVCLLNGGFTSHVRKPNYRMSRGMVVVSLLTAEILTDAIESFNFEDIEPFTVIAIEWNEETQVRELVWDGKASHFSEKPLAPHIWSSSLLYSEEIKSKRVRWFGDFIFKNLKPTDEALLSFHKTAGEGDLKTNLIMDRGFVKTKSISQFVFDGNRSDFRYEDLKTQEITISSL